MAFITPMSGSTSVFKEPQRDATEVDVGDQKPDTYVPSGYKFKITTSKVGFIMRNLALTTGFGLVYVAMGRVLGDSIPLWRAMYFSLITQSTLGYDWMLPKRPIYYAVNSLQLVGLWAMIIFHFIY